MRTNDEPADPKGALKRFVENDAYAKSLGIRTTAVGEGSARCELVLGEGHLNSAGTAHGGLIFSLADAAFSAASNSHGTLAVAIEASISYFTARTEGRLIAEAREVALNSKLATYEIDIRDEGGVPVALFKGTVYRKRQTLDEPAGGRTGARSS